MNLIFTLLILAATLSPSVCMGQGNNEKNEQLLPRRIVISGMVTDSASQRAISYYKFEVYDNVRQITRIDTFVTDRDGSFSITIDRALKLVLFKPFELLHANVILVNLPDSIKKDSIIDIGQLHLNFTSINLKEVLVKDGRSPNPLVRSYAVKKLQSAESPIVRSFLKTLPGISLQKGEFVVDGRKKPIYYLNGIEASAEAVNNIPLDVISKIEIIPTPPLSKRLSINESIINVITKKVSTTQLGGQATAGKGLLRNTDTETISLFENSKKTFVDVSVTSYSNNYKANSNSYWYNNALPIFNEQSDARYKVRPLFSSINFRYNISSKLTLNTIFRYNYQNLDYTGSWLLNQPGVIPMQQGVNTLYKKADHTVGSNTELTYKNSEKSIFFLDATAFRLKTNNTVLNNNAYNANVATVTKGIAQNFAFQLRNELTITNATLESGVIFSNLKNSANFTQTVLPADSVTSGSPKYNISIFSAFANVTSPVKKGMLVVGARVDHNSYNVGENIIKGKLKAYTFIPSVSYALPTEHGGTFIFSYQRDISLPGIDNINTATVSVKPNSYNTGNNNLQPETSDNFEFYNTKDFSDKNLVTDLYYNKTSKLIDYSGFEYIQAGNSLTRQYVNLGSLHKAGINISFTAPLFKKTTLNSNIRFEHYIYNLQTPDNNTLQHFGQNGNLIQLSANITYAISGTFSANFDGSYQNVNYSPFFSEHQRSPDITIELNKSVLKEKLTFSLAWSSMLNWSNTTTDRYASLSASGRTYQTLNTQNVTLSVSYSFGKQLATKSDAPKSIETRKVKQSQAM